MGAVGTTTAGFGVPWPVQWMSERAGELVTLPKLIFVDEKPF